VQRSCMVRADSRTKGQFTGRTGNSLAMTTASVGSPIAGALWLRGFSDRAARVARQAIEELAVQQSLTLCIALTYTATVFFWTGDWQWRREHHETDCRDEEAFTRPIPCFGTGPAGELMFHHGDCRGSIALLSRSLEMLTTEQHLTMVLNSLRPWRRASRQPDSSIQPLLPSSGRSRSAIEVELCSTCRKCCESKQNPDVGSTPRADVGASLLRRSLELARVQSALSWELRTAVALVRMQPDSHARETLRAVYARS